MASPIGRVAGELTGGAGGALGALNAQSERRQA